MKIRNGFVSNSSSSSFVITTRKDLSLSKELLMKAFDVGKNSPLYPVVERMATRLLYCANKRSSIGEMIREDYIEDNEIINKFMNLFNNGRNVYTGSASDQDSIEEAILCDMELNYNTDELTIEKQGGY